MATITTSFALKPHSQWPQDYGIIIRVILCLILKFISNFVCAKKTKKKNTTLSNSLRDLYSHL